MTADGHALAAAVLAGAAAAALVPAPPDLIARLRAVRRSRPAGLGVRAGWRSEATLLLRAAKAFLGTAKVRWSGGTVIDTEAALAIVDRLAALVRAGLTPAGAWEQLARLPAPGRAVCTLVAETVGAGGSAAVALHEAATPAADRGSRAAAGPVDASAVLGWLGVNVSVSERTGAPIADCLERLAAGVRAEVAAADERSSALAGPQATAQILGWLPAGGVLLGAAVGANPVHALVGTSAGRLCAVAGLGAWLSGRLWCRALVRAASRVGG